MGKLSASSRSERKTFDMRTVSKLAYGAGLFIVLGQALIIVQKFIEHSNRGKMDYEKYKELDVDVLESLWEGRRRGNFFGVFGSLFEMIGWVALWLPISVFSEHVGKRSILGRIPPAAFALLAVMVSVDMTFNAGAVGVGDYMSTWHPLTKSVAVNHTSDGGFGAIQSLEISYRMTESHRLWMGAFDSIILGVAMNILGGLARSTGYTNLRHGLLSHVMGGLCYFDFFVSILRYANWRIFMVLEIFTKLVLFIILLPVWVCWLGRIIKSINMETPLSVELANSDALDGGSAGMVSIDVGGDAL